MGLGLSLRDGSSSSLRQIQNNNGGFVADYAVIYPDTTPAQRQKIMSYYPNGALGPLHALAANFAVCQRWHASVPVPPGPIASLR